MIFGHVHSFEFEQTDNIFSLNLRKTKGNMLRGLAL